MPHVETRSAAEAIDRLAGVPDDPKPFSRSRQQLEQTSAGSDHILILLHHDMAVTELHAETHGFVSFKQPCREQDEISKIHASMLALGLFITVINVRDLQT